jgi:replicative DNA helicase
LYKHISYHVGKTSSYLRARKKGEIKSAETSFDGLNDSLLDGIPWGSIVTLVGTSSAGKSTIGEQLLHDILDNDRSVKALSLNFDMLARDSVIRFICKETGMSWRKIQSAKGESLGEEDDRLMEDALKKLSDKSLFSIDRAITVEEISKSLFMFTEEHKMAENKEKLVVYIDYVTLTKKGHSNDAKRTVDDLYEVMVFLKEELTDREIPVIFIGLSQTNRDIFNSSRVKDPDLHFPTEADIFQSSNLFNNSDIVIFFINPSRIRGVKEYGPDRLPIRTPIGNLPYIYWHILKNRGGKNEYLTTVADFRRFTVMDKEKYYNQFSGWQEPETGSSDDFMI